MADPGRLLCKQGAPLGATPLGASDTASGEKIFDIFHIFLRGKKTPTSLRRPDAIRQAHGPSALGSRGIPGWISG